MKGIEDSKFERPRDWVGTTFIGSIQWGTTSTPAWVSPFGSVVQCLGLNVRWRHSVLVRVQSIGGFFRCSIYLEDALNIVDGRSECSDHRNDKERKREKDPPNSFNKMAVSIFWWIRQYALLVRCRELSMNSALKSARKKSAPRPPLRGSIPSGAWAASTSNEAHSLRNENTGRRINVILITLTTPVTPRRTKVYSAEKNNPNRLNFQVRGQFLWRHRDLEVPRNLRLLDIKSLVDLGLNKSRLCTSSSVVDASNLSCANCSSVFCSFVSEISSGKGESGVRFASTPTVRPQRRRDVKNYGGYMRGPLSSHGWWRQQDSLWPVSVQRP